MRSKCAAKISLIAEFQCQDFTPSSVVWAALRVTYLALTITFNCNERNSWFVRPSTWRSTARIALSDLDLHRCHCRDVTPFSSSLLQRLLQPGVPDFVGDPASEVGVALAQVADPDPPNLVGGPRVEQQVAREPVNETVLAGAVPAPEAFAGLLEVVLLGDDGAFAPAAKDAAGDGERLGVAGGGIAGGEVVDFLRSRREVHGAVVVVVVVCVLGCVGGQQEIVASEPVGEGGMGEG